MLKYTSLMECLLTTQTPKHLRLTSQEREEVKDKARWLRRVVNPFLDFYVILAVGVAGSSTTAEVAQG